MVCEVRRPSETQVAESGRQDHRRQLRVRVGREDPRSFDGIGRQLWFEDIGAAIECMLEALETVGPLADQIEEAEINRRRDDELARVRDRIRQDPADWRKKLMDLCTEAE